MKGYGEVLNGYYKVKGANLKRTYYMAPIVGHSEKPEIIEMVKRLAVARSWEK